MTNEHFEMVGNEYKPLLFGESNGIDTIDSKGRCIIYNFALDRDCVGYMPELST